MNGYSQQFTSSFIKKLVKVFGEVLIGASGAVTSASGNHVASVTKLATGIYQIQLMDNYSWLHAFQFAIESPVTGAAVTDGSFVTGTLYQIVTLGTTNWTAIGLPTGLTAAVGQVFVATGAGGAGLGTAKAIGNSGITEIEVPTGVQTMLVNSGGSVFPGTGAYVFFQTFAPTASGNTARILTSPASGTRIRFELSLRNSALAA